MKGSIGIGLASIVAIALFVGPFAGSVEEGQIFQTETLPNGLEIIFVENHNIPLVSVVMAIKNGALAESPEYDGLSHFYEHMFFKANKEIPSQEEYMEELRRLGAWWNGWTSTETVAYFFTVPKENFEDTLQFMENAIRFPLFDEKELEREKGVILAEYDRTEADPYRALGTAMDEQLWHEYYSRKNVIGNRTVIATNTREKMLTIQQRYYVPNNCALIIAGDMSAEEAFNSAESIFSDWERGEDPFELYPVPEHPPLKESRAAIVERPVGMVTLSMEWQGPGVYKNTDDTHAADLFSYVLNNPNSNFQKNLVDSGLFSSCSISYYTQNHTGPISITAQTTPEKFFEAKDALFGEIEKFDDVDYVSEEEIEDAKAMVEVTRAYELEALHNSFAPSSLPFSWAVTGLDYYASYVDNIKDVSIEDITKYASNYIVDKPFVIGVLLNPQSSLRLEESDLI
ncbi:MAG: pitrilysin family protein [Candidatus Thermoplasmatota archaeon]|nr:pitrilysin family protein [Candidatus Thermoplasmatota archaeon]